MHDLFYLSLCLIPFVTCLWLYPLMKRQFAAEVNDNGKISTIDGLRGVAATAVIVHHGILMTNLFVDSHWEINAGYVADFSSLVHRVLTQLGSFGVTVFFMITGYLFWTKALKNGVGQVSVFYRRRLFRLVPMYLVAVTGVYLLSSAIGFTERMDAHYLVKSLSSWLSFGFIKGETLTDHKPGWLILCGVFWTLAIEIKFYVLFPLLASRLVQGRRRLGALAWTVVVLLLLHWSAVISSVQFSILFAFICGMMAATLQTFPGFCAETAAINRRPWLKTLMGIVALAAIGLGFYLFDFAYNGLAVLLIGLFFIITATGNDLWGLLNARPLRFSGLISYSTYLLHGLVLSASFTWVYPRLGAMAALGIAFVGVIVLSALSYLKIEKPFMALGHRKQGACGGQTQGEPSLVER